MSGGFIKHDGGKPQLDLLYKKAFELAARRRPRITRRDHAFYGDIVYVSLQFGFGIGEIVEGMADVLAYGAEKYDRNNWMLNTWEGRHRIVAAKRRHFLGCITEEYDKETGYHHAFHALVNSMFLLYLRDKRAAARKVRKTGKADYIHSITGYKQPVCDRPATNGTIKLTKKRKSIKVKAVKKVKSSKSRKKGK